MLVFEFDGIKVVSSAKVLPRSLQVRKRLNARLQRFDDEDYTTEARSESLYSSNNKASMGSIKFAWFWLASFENFKNLLFRDRCEITKGHFNNNFKCYESSTCKLTHIIYILLT